MRILFLIILFGGTDSLYSQDTIEEKSDFLVLNCDYLYNQYFGHRTVEYFPGSTSTTYSKTTVINTSGFLASCGYRHNLSNHFFIQPGIGFRLRIGSYIHDDSVVNATNSSLEKANVNYNSLESPFYFGIQSKRVSFSCGFIIPLITYHYRTSYFSDGSKSRNSGYLNVTRKFYLSEKLQFKLFKKQSIGISIGADVSPDIFRKNSAYKINWNAGIMYVIERHKKEQIEDYVK